MISRVAMDRIVEKQRAADPEYRKNAAGKVLRSDAKWLTDGERFLIWEYPREAPDGDQVDLVEVMEIADRLIQHHRVYWGCFGTALLTRSAANKTSQKA